ncbi:MAG: FUSC family protein [Candidatus Nitrosopolaris sp.]
MVTQLDLYWDFLEVDYCHDNYWTNSGLTITFTSMMIIGTIAGALIAAVITLETSNLYLVLALLFSFAVVVFATMRVNIILTQIFLVLFIILLLNIYYPCEWYLSFIRILDVAIGGLRLPWFICSVL